MKFTCYVWYIYIMRVNLEFPIMVNCIKTNHGPCICIARSIFVPALTH